MKPFLASAVTLTLALGASGAQTPPVRIYSNPAPIPRDVLERLSLTQAWATRVKLEGSRDGFFSVQLLPPVGRKNHLLLLQTLRGTVVCLDAENGDLLWRAQVGLDYQVMQPAAFNSQAIFTSRRDRLHVLDRDTGAEILYDVQKDGNLPVWGIQLEGVPSAGLAADEEQLYICIEKRVSGYFVPDFRRLQKLRAADDPLPSGQLRPSPQVRREWTNVLAPLQLFQRPLEYKDFLGLVSTDGTFVHVNKFDGKDTFRYQVNKPVQGRIAQYDNFAYLGSDDYTVYALDMARGRLAWRFAAMAPVVLPVYATERDVWAAPGRRGLHRIDRKSGDKRWGQRDAEHFLATNHKYVYAADRQGHLMVLDYEHGTKLAKYDVRDWTLLFANELTDRIYLAAHDGQIVCLRHRDGVKPLRHWGAPAEKPPKVPPKKKPGIGRAPLEWPPYLAPAPVLSRAPEPLPSLVPALADARRLWERL
jgi:hypothetical protein